MRTIVLAVITASIFIQTSVNAQTCQVAFTTKNGSEITDYPVVIEGNAVNVPIGGHLWILSHLSSIGGWWPQGNEPRTITDDHQWTCGVFLGRPGETGIFEVSAVVVDDQENTILLKWVDAGIKTNYYPPIRFPDSMPGCNIATIRVNKK